MRGAVTAWWGCLALGVGAALGAEPPEAPPGPVPEVVAKLDQHHHKEASGLAPSLRRDDLLWLINDSGAQPRLQAISTTGKDLGHVTVKGGWNRDWEDLASFELDGKAYLAIGDIGDNAANRREAFIYIVEEPQLAGKKFGDKESVQVAWKLRFRYPPGPRDAEAMAVDAPAGFVYLLTKFEVPKKLYRLPLRPLPDAAKNREPLVAKRLGPVNIPIPTKELKTMEAWKQAMRGLLVTSMAFDAQRGRVALLTYDRALVYRKTPAQSWLAALKETPQSIPLPPAPQNEGLCFSRDGHSLYIASERKKNDPGLLVRVDLPAPDTRAHPQSATGQ